MKSQNKNIEIDFIKPKDITPKRLKKNDINFMIIYDLLEAFHNDKNDQKKEFTRIARIISKAPNIYPNFNYQKFINDKSKYIEYLKKKKVPIIPTFKITCDKIKELGFKKAAEHIIKRVKKNNWKKFITKPIFGQESIDFYAYKQGYDKAKTELVKYLKKISGIKYCQNKKIKIKKIKKIKYPGILIQEYLEGFDKDKPEIRMYFFDNDNYKYSVITHNGKVDLPTSEFGKLKISSKKLNDLKRFAKQILKKTPEIKINSIVLPKAMTRIDIATSNSFGKPYNVNELEFVPSLYVQDVLKTIPEIHLGNAFNKVLKKYTAESKRKKKLSKKKS